eukprot:14448365-Alexandrium_andersonii.AAC.1
MLDWSHRRSCGSTSRTSKRFAHMISGVPYKKRRALDCWHFDPCNCTPSLLAWNRALRRITKPGLA